MVSKWEKVFFIVAILAIIVIAVFHKQVAEFFAGDNRQEQVMDTGGKKDSREKKKDKKDKKDDDKSMKEDRQND